MEVKDITAQQQVHWSGWWGDGSECEGKNNKKVDHFNMEFSYKGRGRGGGQ